jgi:hypothetical protein
MPVDSQLARLLKAARQAPPEASFAPVAELLAYLERPATPVPQCQHGQYGGVCYRQQLEAEIARLHAALLELVRS